MTGAKFNHHLNLERKKLFDADMAERDRDRKKYKGISPHDSAYAFNYRWQQKIVKTLPRLSEIYEFKIKWEDAMAESPVTNEMLFAAVKQAVAEKLLPVQAPAEIYEQNYAAMKRIIEAAINAKDE